MNKPLPDLSALIGSRICHDLVSPLGAIGNGVELLGMNQPPSAELDLIHASVAHALARIRMFRLAFGAVRGEQRISGREVASILEGLGRGGRIRFEWSLPTDLPRQDAKLLLLLVQCCESAMAWGGALTIAHEDAQIRIAAQAPRLRIDDALWTALNAARPPADPGPAEVHFALVPGMLATTGRRLALRTGPETIELSL
ncbi:MAG: histidine phosphotransferase ChpT [Rhodobacteraceae bacterium HLUCCA12]|nr:MAG: histidine phosphotransferase ChpT [Rhodobacteraceae bacterium HLUCCA12]